MAIDTSMTQAWPAVGTVAAGTTVIQNKGVSPVCVATGAAQPVDLDDGVTLTGSTSLTIADGQTYWIRKCSPLDAKVSITVTG